MLSLEEARVSYDRQKQEREEKQKELEALRGKLALQKAELDQQKNDKEYLLSVTKNDEKRYQDLLTRAQAEFQAIQAIIAGRGEEKEVGLVKEGEKIATVISGKSVCSTGTHLHFEVRDGDTPRNPTDYLKQISLIWDNKPDGPFSFSGSWRWPLSEPIRITQGFGDTFYARTLRYYGGNPHSGLDMVNDSGEVFSVANGTLYNGSIDCGGGKLRYVRVKHEASNFSTYYLHINYVKV